ncbi:uncharacterized protein LOC133902148 isoform X2 [Phragmites australis]|nr:uncharacterized protein LOC133902148 isoform X2 [Phragmites australis]
MLARKRGADDLTRFSNENKRTCSGGGETTESLISGDLCSCDWDSNQGVRSELSEEVASNLSKCVVSLCPMDTPCYLHIAIECRRNVTKFLTSASLVRALEDETKGHDNVKIEVRYEGNVVIGLLEEYDLNHEIAVVKVCHGRLDLQPPQAAAAGLES